MKKYCLICKAYCHLIYLYYKGWYCITCYKNIKNKSY